MPQLNKPVYPRVNWSNRLAQRLVMDCPFWEKGGTSYTDSVKKKVFTMTNTPTWSTGLYGPGLTFLNTSSQYSATSAPVSTVQDNFTMQIVWYFNAQTIPDAAEQMLFYNGTDNSGCGIGINVATAEFLIGGIARVTGGGVTAGTYTNLILRRRAGTMRLYRDGKYDNATSASTPNTPAIATTIGCEYQGGTSTPFRFTNGTAYFARFWERPLDESEIRLLGVNPLALYQRVPYTWADVIAAGVTNTSQLLMMMGIG